MSGDEIRCARREIKVPRTRHKSSRDDPIHADISICRRLAMVGYYQVAAHTTPNPLS